jgi:hypothetical protein
MLRSLQMTGAQQAISSPMFATCGAVTRANVQYAYTFLTIGQPHIKKRSPFKAAGPVRQRH